MAVPLIAAGVAGLAGYLATRDEGVSLFGSDDEKPDVEVADIGLQPPQELGSGVDGRKPMEYLKPRPPRNSAEYNPIQAEIDVNSVPGRYDNLPRLQSVYGDTRYELHPWQAHEFNWDGQRTAGSLLERQYTTLTPHETPLSYGILPNMKRGTGVMLRDPDTGDMLKPQKKENLDTDMFVAHGDPLPFRDVRVNQGVTSEARQRAREQSKYMSGAGALNDFMPVDQPGVSGEDGGGVGGPLRGFSTGEVMSRRTGGFHPRERFHRVDETKSGRNQHVLRSLNPTKATWNAGSIYQTGTAPLGILRENANADVREWHRPPEPTSGIARQHVQAPFAQVDMHNVQRDLGEDPGWRKRHHKLGAGMRGKTTARQYDPDDVFDQGGEGGDPFGDDFGDMSDPMHRGTQRCWTGPAGGTSNTTMPTRREIDMYTRPKNLQDFQLEGWETAAHGSQMGLYNNEDYSMDLCDRMTNRTTMDDQTTRAPMPHRARGNNSAYNFEDTLRGAGHDTTIMGRAGNPIRPEDATADAFSGQRFQEINLRNTQKDDPEFIYAEKVHAPVADRRLAMQYDPQPACPITRRQQPEVSYDIDFGGTAPYRSNPYTQPLPNPGFQQQLAY